MKGMEMLMKTMGLDPDALMGMVNDTAEMARAGLANVNAKLDRIEQNQILLYQLMVKAGTIAPVENPASDTTKIAEENSDANRIN